MNPADFEEELTRYEAAQLAFIRGDAEPGLRMWSGRDDITLANPLGAPVRGPEQVVGAAQRAVSQVRDGQDFAVERISAFATADLGYVHWIERARLRIGGDDRLRPVALRVTAIFRREDGEWRVIHRHADPITGPRPIESIIADSA